MIWQADNFVMLGSNQIAEAEVDIRYAKQNDIQIVRRSSGGGAIYTDMGTLLYTMIMPHEKDRQTLEAAKSNVTSPVTKALNKLGIPAVVEGRNDILLDKAKISGLAQYVKSGRACAHCSLLYNTDLEKLARVLSVDEEKISSKALRSVRSRVTNISEHMDNPPAMAEFWGLLKQEIFQGKHIRELSLTAYDLAEINQIYEQKYGTHSWTFEQSPRFSLNNTKRFAGGKLDVYLDVDKGVIKSCSIRGDFLGFIPVRALEEKLENKRFQYKNISEALDGIEMEPYLGSVTCDELLSVMFY